jgi:2-amino-4-hydroxy-6-hydroxymethyldihydropteridine diphosphokinase
MGEVFLGLGSNVGDREGNVRKALQILKKKMRVLKVSSMYETEPMYVEDQKWFVNCVAKLETDLRPRELLDYVKDTERTLGRQRTIKYGPRVIDLDILFYGNEVVRESDLHIPHPKIRERSFVLIPLVEIEPDFIHPIQHMTVLKLLSDLNSNKSVIKKCGPCFN